jgi:histidine phosphotransferase ChpT
VATLVGRPDNAGIEVLCIGPAARPPQHLREFLATPSNHPVDALSVQAYYTTRLARASSLHLTVTVEGADVVMAARPDGSA